MEKVRVTAWITAPQAGALRLVSKRHREEEAAYIRALEKDGMRHREARIAAAAKRREWWPPIEELVAAAVERRLAEPDLAGPWEPLAAWEAGRMALSGRWPGPAVGPRLVQRNWALPIDLVIALRTASWRLSEEPLAELDRRKLIGSGRVLSDAERAERDRLAELLYSPARIIRQALEPYGSGVRTPETAA
jgi:hypothetical protein